jgi:hypothetical protein
MAFQLCGVFINAVPGEQTESNIEFNPLQGSDPLKLDTLSPRKLSIGFTEEAIIILLDMLFVENISAESTLTPLERDITSLIPDGSFFIAFIDHVNSSCGYSFVIEGKKRRTKAVINNEICIDFGELLKNEYEQLNDFTNSLKKISPAIYEMMEEKFKQEPEGEKEKAYLVFRDLLFKDKIELKYSDGSWDEEICETLIAKSTGMNVYDIEENVRFVQFEKREMNFGKDSLKDFIFSAWTILQKNNSL